MLVSVENTVELLIIKDYLTEILIIHTVKILFRSFYTRYTVLKKGLGSGLGFEFMVQVRFNPKTEADNDDHGAKAGYTMDKLIV